jgi:hypothetical protein
LLVGEDARPERPPRGVDRSPGLVVHLAVHGESARLLKGPYGAFHGRVVHRVGLGRFGVLEEP